MGNFVCENDKRIGIADFIGKISFIMANAFQLMTFGLRGSLVFGAQSVYSADKGYAHGILHNKITELSLAGGIYMKTNFKVKLS